MDSVAQSFYEASGIKAESLSFDIRLLVGGFAILFSLFILTGLMHLLDSQSAWDKTIFLMSLIGLAFILMLIFIYIA